MSVQIEKIPGGLRVDGLALMKGKCGCTSVARCCHSWSKVKRSNSTIHFTAKMTTPDTVDTFQWSYTVQKEGVTVRVSVEDAGDKEIFSGYLPPSVQEWMDRGWRVLEKQGDRRDGVVWRCAMCKWLYKNDSQEVAFEDLPGEWVCPVCGAPKSVFEEIG